MNPYREPYLASLNPSSRSPHAHEPRLPHSGLGIASFGLSLFCGVAAFVTVAIAGVIDASTPGGMQEDSAAAIIVGLGMIAVFGLVVVGGGIGAVALFQSDRNRLFAILGVVVNALIVVGICGLMAIGLAMEPPAGY